MYGLFVPEPFSRQNVISGNEENTGKGILAPQVNVSNVNQPSTMNSSLLLYSVITPQFFGSLSLIIIDSFSNGIA